MPFGLVIRLDHDARKTRERIMSLVSLELDTAELAQQYDRISAERQFRVGQLLIRDLALQPGESVLDIGSGTGLLAEHAAGIVGPGGPVIGIDPLPLRVEIAQLRRIRGDDRSLDCKP